MATPEPQNSRKVVWRLVGTGLAAAKIGTMSRQAHILKVLGELGK